MILNSLPDAKGVHDNLTLGKNYEILREIGNGVVIKLDNKDERIVILKERFT